LQWSAHCNTETRLVRSDPAGHRRQGAGLGSRSATPKGGVEQTLAFADYAKARAAAK